MKSTCKSPNLSVLRGFILFSEKMLPDPTLTFSNFIETPRNRLTVNGCSQFSEFSFDSTKALFLYGAAGTGKTHLLNAVANRVIQDKPEAKIAIISSEAYTSHLIKAIRQDEMTAFRQQYRQLDLLLIDGIEHISGKEYTQEEFTHNFNDLISNNGRVFATSSVPPSQIGEVRQALISRILMGLVLDLKQPSESEIFLILSRKYDSLSNSIPRELLELASDHSVGDIRRAEGIVSKILLYRSTNDCYPNVAEVVSWVNEVLEDEPRITKSIEFPPGYQNAGFSILTYFGHILSVKYPKLRVRVKFEQEGLSLRMIVYTPDGQKEEIERTLETYGMVVTGKLRPEDFLENPLEVMALKNKLEIVNLELRQAKQLLDMSRDNSQRRIESLESQINKLHSLVEQSLQSRNTAFGAITKVAEAKTTTYNLNHTRFGGGLATDGAFQKSFINISSANTLPEAANHIQKLLQVLREQDVSEECIQEQAAHELSKQAEADPSLMGKLVKWGKSLADTASKTTVSEATKGVIKLALHISGIPI